MPLLSSCGRRLSVSISWAMLKVPSGAMASSACGAVRRTSASVHARRNSERHSRSTVSWPAENSGAPFASARRKSCTSSRSVYGLKRTSPTDICRSSTVCPILGTWLLMICGSSQKPVPAYTAITPAPPAAHRFQRIAIKLPSSCHLVLLARNPDHRREYAPLRTEPQRCMLQRKRSAGGGRRRRGVAGEMWLAAGPVRPGRGRCSGRSRSAARSAAPRRCQRWRR